MKITLRMARENCKLGINEAAKKIGICPRTLKKWERDNRKVRFERTLELSSLYKISLNHIFIGQVEDFQRERMSVIRLEDVVDLIKKAEIDTTEIEKILQDILEERKLAIQTLV